MICWEASSSLILSNLKRTQLRCIQCLNNLPPCCQRSALVSLSVFP